MYCNKGKYNFFSDFTIFLYALIVAEYFCRAAETVKRGFCSSSLGCLSLTGAICVTAFDPAPSRTEGVHRGRGDQDLGSGCPGV